MAKKEKAVSMNIINDLEKRKEFKSALATLTHYLQQIDDHKEGLKEAVSDISEKYGVEKKHVRKLANTMFKHNYYTLQEENRHFEVLYELLVEGKLRDDPSSDDPMEEPSE
jgi:hypothetical protein